MTKYCVYRFCERIIPVQITCSMTQQALVSAAQRLAKLHAKQAVEASGDQLVKFAGQSTIFLQPSQCMEAIQPVSPAHVSLPRSLHTAAWSQNSHAEQLQLLERADNH